LKKLSTAPTPAEKCGILVSGIREITKCVHAYWDAKGEDSSSEKFAM